MGIFLLQQLYKDYQGVIPSQNYRHLLEGNWGVSCIGHRDIKKA